MKRLIRFAFTAQIITAVTSAMVTTQGFAQVCRVPTYASLNNFVPPHRPTDLRSEELWLDADAVDGDETWLIGRGNAFLEHDSYQIRGEVLRYNRLTSEAFAKNAITTQNGIITHSDHINFSGQDTTKTMTSVDFFLQESSAHGHAEKVVAYPNNTHMRAYHATYTTCDVENPTWYFKAKRIDYHSDRALAIARHIQLRVKDVPVFYFPYYRFDRPSGSSTRQSGFLNYDINYRSKQGVIFVQPFYLNIAPNVDATISAGYLQKFGPMLHNEFRYLTENSEGIFETRHLHYKDTHKTSSMRRWQHRYHLDQPLDGAVDQVDFTIDYNTASDKKVLGDMFDGFYDSASNHLRQQAHLQISKNIGATHLTAGIMQRHYDILAAPGNSPYFYKPQLYVKAEGSIPGAIFGAPIKWQAGSSYTNLVHPRREEARRLAANVKLSHRLQRPFGFLNTTLQYRSRNYRFPDNSQAGFAVPTVEIDGALRFEKTYQNGVRHEITPRLYYAYTPYQQQSSIPRFESTARSENYNTLFNADRFTDQDRIGDVNKVTFGVENRFYDGAGDLRVETRLAQSLFIQSPRLKLDGTDNTLERKRSQAYVDATAHLTDRISVDTSAVFDDNDYALNRIDGGISYRADPLAIRLGYLNDRVDNDQYVNLSGVAPINDKVRVMGRLQYDINNHGITEQLLGIEYGDCCTIARLGYRGYRDNVSDDFKNRAMIEIELSGVGQVESGGEFTRRIFGFKRR